MSRSEYHKFTTDVKAKLSDIIINFNSLEQLLKLTLCEYIRSSRSDFVLTILLHNSIMPFNTKLTILKYIFTKEGIKFKDWEKFHKLINIRNAVAHSDNLLNFEGEIIGEEIVDDEYEIRIPIYEQYIGGPKITVVKDGKINEKGLDKMHSEFNENLHDIEKVLNEINIKLSQVE